MQIVDTHVHLYHPDERAFPMGEDPVRPPPGTGTVEHLRREMAAHGVARAVLVQTGSAYRWDNRLVTAVAQAHRDWACAVCNLDPAGEGSVAELERLVATGAVRGLRLEGCPAGYDHPGSRRLWAAAERLGIAVCAHLSPAHLPALAALLAFGPGVPVVLDHCAYPQVLEQGEDPGVAAVGDLARFPRLHLKLSFGVTSSRQEYPFRDAHPLLRRFIEAYGPERCMWGSDFPCEHWLKKATYGQHLALFTEELGLSPGEQTAILGETAARFWFGG